MRTHHATPVNQIQLHDRLHPVTLPHPHERTTIEAGKYIVYDTTSNICAGIVTIFEGVKFYSKYKTAAIFVIFATF